MISTMMVRSIPFSLAMRCRIRIWVLLPSNQRNPSFFLPCGSRVAGLVKTPCAMTCSGDFSMLAHTRFLLRARTPWLYRSRKPSSATKSSASSHKGLGRVHGCHSSHTLGVFFSHPWTVVFPSFSYALRLLLRVCSLRSFSCSTIPFPSAVITSTGPVGWSPSGFALAHLIKKRQNPLPPVWPILRFDVLGT